jgi:hypothetical protein
MLTSMFRVVALVLLVAGCADRDEAQLAAIRATVCACKTSACAELAMKEVPHDNVHPTRRTQAIARDMMDCVFKLYEAERPAEPDDASDPGSAAPASAEKP